MRVVVTGGAGFIGSHTVDLLIERGHEVWVLDNRSSGVFRSNPAAHDLGRMDVCAKGDVVTVFQQAAPVDAVIHLAAQPSLFESIKHPKRDAQTNILGTLNVLSQCNPYVSFVLASTGAVYGRRSDLPFREEDELQPATPYAVSKAAAELYVRLRTGPAAILRYSNVYGPRQVRVGENQVVPRMIGFMLGNQQERKFTVNGNGKQTRDFVYVNDVARANVMAVENRAEGTYNVSSNQDHSILDLARILRKFTGLDATLRHGPAVAEEARHILMDNRLAAAQMGWRPEVSFEAGLELTTNWWKGFGDA